MRKAWGLNFIFRFLCVRAWFSLMRKDRKKGNRLIYCKEPMKEGPLIHAFISCTLLRRVRWSGNTSLTSTTIQFPPFRARSLGALLVLVAICINIASVSVDEPLFRARARSATAATDLPLTCNFNDKRLTAVIDAELHGRILALQSGWHELH